MTFAPALVCGLCFGLGVTGIFAFWPRPSIGNPRLAANGEDLERSSAPLHRSSCWRLLRIDRPKLLRLGMAAGVGLLSLLVTGWPVAALLGGVAAYGIPTLFGRTAASVSIAKIEAIAVWTELLQGTLAASAGLTEAITATATLSPPVMREATLRLAARLNSGTHPGEALTQFADELDDPCADRVVCALLLAASSRAQRLSDLLTALADSTREEVALRLRIETSRSSVRSSVRTVLGFSIVFAVGLTLLGHHYLAPFGTARGQVALLAVGALYGVGLTLMVSLARPPAPTRLVGRRVMTQ